MGPAVTLRNRVPPGSSSTDNAGRMTLEQANQMFTNNYQGVD